MADNSAPRKADPLDVAEAVEAMVGALPEDAQDPVDVRVRAALTGYARGLRDAVEALGAE